MMTQAAADAPLAESHRRMVESRPTLSRIAPVHALVPAIPARTLLHAGPPFADPAELPAPVFNSVVAAARLEGWVDDGPDGATAVQSALARGAIGLSPGQDSGVVTPLAFVVGPSMPALEVVDAAGVGQSRVAPLNDGPPPHALRLGTGSPEGLAFLRHLHHAVAPALREALPGPVPLLAIMSSALEAGDDLHGRVAAMQASIMGILSADMQGATRDYLEAANQFALNVVMAAAAVMLSAAAGVRGSPMVVAAGGNGRDFGWKQSHAADRWVTGPAAVPVGPRFTGNEAARPLPAIGDSAVIDAVGFGAACLRFAPELAGPLAGHVDPCFMGGAAHDPFVGPHPAFPEGIRVGLDLTRKRSCLGVMLGIIEATGRDGIIGRGVAPWPPDADR